MKRLLLGTTLLLCSIPSVAAATQRVWIIEFGSLPAASGALMQIATLPWVAKQNLDTTAGVQTSAAFNFSTRYIRIICEVQCAIRADGKAAAATDLPLPAYTAEYFGVQPGKTLSVIAAP